MGAIDLDPASHVVAQRTVRATRFYTRHDGGLAQPWHGRIWLNPPYTQPLIAQFIDKLVVEVSASRVTEAIMLTHNYTDTSWFHAAAAHAGRIRFSDIDGYECTPTQGQAFFYFGPQLDRFAEVFRQFGLVAMSEPPQ
jgi:DNA N-6-adenine-methyltransferase Dam